MRCQSSIMGRGVEFGPHVPAFSSLLFMTVSSMLLPLTRIETSIASI